MRAYFDIANLVSLLRAKPKGASNIKDLMSYHNLLSLLGDKLELYLDTSKKEFERGEVGQALIKMMYNWTPKIKFEKSHLTTRPIKQKEDFTSCLTDKEHHSAIYCLKDDAVAKIAEEGNYHIAKKGEELKVLSELFAYENQFSKHLDITEPKAFDEVPWAPLKEFARPCSDIIVADSYILTREDRIHNNLARFLLTLCGRLKPLSTINIVIFCSDKTEKNDENGNVVEMIPDFQNARSIIKKLLSDHNIFSNVSIVSVKKEVLAEHDRTVFTNYMWYIPGASLNVYDKHKNLITRGRHFHIDSLVEPESYKSAFRFIDKLQAVIDNIKENPENGSFHLEENTKKLSNYLTF